MDNPTEYVFDCTARLRKKVEGRFRVTRSNQIHFVSTGDPIVIHIAKIDGDVGINDPTKTNGKAYIKIKYAGEDLIFELRSLDGSPSPAELQSEFMRLYSRIIKHIKSATHNEPISPRNTEPAVLNNNSQNELSNGSVDETGQPKKNKVLFDIQVVDSKKIEEGADPHVEYRVVSKTNLPHYQSTQHEVYHRYSEFELLRRQLTDRYPSIAVPSLPSKSFVNRFNPQFIENRCKDLNEFMKKIATYKEMYRDSYLQHFLEHSSTSDSKPAAPSSSGYLSVISQKLADQLIDNRLISAAEKKIVKAFGEGPQPLFKSAVEEDYWKIKQLMKRWHLTPKKLPFDKFVVLLLGVTSAGKSAFVNHFFTLPCKKSSAGQLDTNYTIIEVVSTDVFAKFSKRYREVRDSQPSSEPSTWFTHEELHAPVKELSSDKRNGVVFHYLSNVETYTRYEEQLSQIMMDKTSREVNLFQSILINDEFLMADDEDHPDIELARRTIMIDSPGFDSGDDYHQLADDFLGNLRLLQFLINMSDFTLYMVPATQLNMVSTQIAMLELSILYAIHGASAMNDLTQAAYSFKKTTKKNLMAQLSDFIAAKISKNADEVRYKGTAYWNKFLFVLSQIDLVSRSYGKQSVNDFREQYYEIGRLLGRTLSYLDPPVCDSIVCIGLPEHQQTSNVVVQGDLAVLKSKLQARDAQAPYYQKLEEAIRNMSHELQTQISASWSTLLTSDLQTVSDILKRSLDRTK